MGLLITNGEFVSFHGPDPTMVRIGVPEGTASPQIAVIEISRKGAKAQRIAENSEDSVAQVTSSASPLSPFPPVSPFSPTHSLIVSPAPPFSGSVRFSNCAFWGPCNQIARIGGSGTVGFSDCTFVQWDSQKRGLPAILANGGTLLVRGCEFRQAGKQLLLEEGINRAIVTDNVFAGPERVTNKSKGKVTVARNVGG
jgi:hypothetical protein